jgi:plastocyanin
MTVGLSAGIGATSASAQPVGPAGYCNPAWRIVQSPSVATGNSILFSTSAASATDAWTVGYFDDGTSLRTLTEHWNGARWTIVASPVAGDGYDLLGSVSALSSDDAWAVGSHQPFGGAAQALAMHWDGSSWTLAGVPQFGSGDTRLLGVAEASTDDVWAVGAASAADAPAVIIHWDGQTWKPSTAPNLDGTATLRDVTVRSSDDVWAVGSLLPRGADANSTALILHWNGASWAQVAAPSGAGARSLNGISALSASDAWAVGQTASGIVTSPISMHWDGSTWSDVSTSEPPSSSSTLSAVAATSPDDAWAVGGYVGPGGVSHLTLIEHWDGATWRTVTSANAKPHQFNVLTDVTSVPQGGLWAPGYYAAHHVDKTIAERLCPTSVHATGFVPAASRVSTGQTIVWRIDDPNGPHRVVDGTGMGLFDSGELSMGQTFTYTFDVAGAYATLDPDTGRPGEIDVNMSALRSHDDPTVWSVHWADTVPSGFVVDVQIQRPGSSDFEPWLSSQSVAAASFAPDAGSGAYLFRSKVTALDSGCASDWSPTLTISVP